MTLTKSPWEIRFQQHDQDSRLKASRQRPRLYICWTGWVIRPSTIRRIIYADLAAVICAISAGGQLSTFNSSPLINNIQSTTHSI
jgi:hypothetical protein